MAPSPIWPVGVGSQLGAQWELWTGVLGPSSHGPLHGLFGLLHSMVSGFPRVSVLREQGRNIWRFYDLPLKVTKYLFCYILLVEAVKKSCPGSRGEDIDSTS